MKYRYNSRRKVNEYEKDLVDYWKKHKTFEKSIEQRPEDNGYVFYDGPPFLTGMPHHGHLLGSAIKDAVGRYWTMKGRRVERVWGWDCHGLPAENYVEKVLDIKDRRDIGTKVSLEKYIETAKESMNHISGEWRHTIDRLGRWVDMDNAYRTMNKDFMESVWWAFKTLYEKGKIYEGEKVLMYDTKFATPVSKTEVTMDNEAYREVTDPSVYVKFRLINDEANATSTTEDPTTSNTYLLAWTTTPWTLPANMAIAINPDFTYLKVKLDNEELILAKDLAEKVLVDEKHQPLKYDILTEIPGQDLVGKKYQPIFTSKFNQDEHAHKIWPADYVDKESGTGLVHIAPAYGEADFELGQREHIPTLHTIDDNGYYFPEFAEQLRAIGVRNTDDDGIEVWSANKFIAKCLQEAGTVWKIEYIKHDYPFNPRSGQRIMYRAFPSWFFEIQSSKPLMLEKNENINWFPAYLKHGRFEKNIEAAPDWNISRDRFWATAMPVWKGDKGTVKVVGSYDELYELSGVRLEDYHRPWVDEIEFDLDGEHFKRIDKVLDCWFESGSMPFAQLHYPFENKEKFEKNYPADFIVEYIGQVRAWFYYVHAVNTALFGENAYTNVITTGTIAGNDGRKMSKSLGNFTDPNELMDKFSADALRFLLLSSPLLSGEDFAMQDKDVSDVYRKLNMIWNMYDFFTMYAEVDGWEFNTSKKKGDKQNITVPELTPDQRSNPLDKWIISRIHELTAHLTRHLDEYNFPEAMSKILPLIDDISNWYVRRSRRRFWKSEDDGDKSEAYETLHYVLVKLAMLLAPFTPFLADELYQNLTGGESVHLLDWPTNLMVDVDVLDAMARTRAIIERGLATRMEKNDEYGQVKVRQPLAKLVYEGEKLPEFYEQIIADEVNIKQVENGNEFYLDKSLTPELCQEGFIRELIRHVQKARKTANLNVDDRIKLSVKNLPTDLPKDLLDLLCKETLATTFDDGNYQFDTIVKVDDLEMTITLEKA